MGRRYGVICSFFAGVIIISLMCYGSYRYADKPEEEEQVTEDSTQTGTEKEQTVAEQTKYVIEKYDQESKEIVREEQTIPTEYVGLTRSQMEERLAEEMATLSKEEEEDGLVSISLQSFSAEQIVVRNIYSKKEQEGFTLKLLDGEVAIYSGDGEELYEKTGIQEENLTGKDRKSLQKGLTVKNEKELYSILENFSS